MAAQIGDTCPWCAHQFSPNEHPLDHMLDAHLDKMMQIVDEGERENKKLQDQITEINGVPVK